MLSAKNPAAAIEPCDNVIWWQLASPGPLHRYLWSQREITELAGCGVALPSAQQLLARSAENWTRPIRAARSRLDPCRSPKLTASPRSTDVFAAPRKVPPPRPSGAPLLGKEGRCRYVVRPSSGRRGNNGWRGCDGVVRLAECACVEASDHKPKLGNKEPILGMNVVLKSGVA